MESMQKMESVSGSTPRAIGIRHKQVAEVWSEVLRRALITTCATGAALALRHNGGIMTFARIGCTAPDLGTYVDLHNSFAGLCVQTGRTLHCDYVDSGTCVNAAAWDPGNIAAMVVTPVHQGAAVAGVLAVFSHKPNAFVPGHDGVLEKLALTISSTLRKPKNAAPQLQDRLAPAPAVSAASPPRRPGPALLPPQEPRVFAGAAGGTVENRRRATVAPPPAAPQQNSTPLYGRIGEPGPPAALPHKEVSRHEPARAVVQSSHILRFHKSERMLHWSIAIPFLVCFTTALILVIFYNPHPQRAFRVVFASLHRISGACLILLPMLTAFRHRRDHRIHFYNVREALTWVWDDVKWLFLMGAAAVSSKVSLPEQGKFNAAEKMNFIMVMCTYPLFIATGLILSVVHVAFLSWVLHVGMAAMAAPLVLGHIFMATINPETRVGLSGMLTGYVDRHWARHHYTRWYREFFEDDHVHATRPPRPVQRQGPLIQLRLEAE